MGSHMRRVSALGDDAGIGPLCAIGIELLRAIGLVFVLALPAVEARVRLGSDTDSLAGLDQGDLGSNAEGSTDDFCGN